MPPARSCHGRRRPETEGANTPNTLSSCLPASGCHLPPARLSRSQTAKGDAEPGDAVHRGPPPQTRDGAEKGGERWSQRRHQIESD